MVIENEGSVKMMSCDFEKEKEEREHPKVSNSSRSK
jgi:hypothetical protein